MITFNKDRDVEELLQGIVRLSPEDFIALTEVLGVKKSYIEEETKKPILRDAAEIIEDVVFEFRKLKHKERKIILKAVAREAAKNGTVS